MAEPAHAYIGPGAGVSVLGALAGLVSVLFLASWALIRWSAKSVLSIGRKRQNHAVAAGAPTQTGPAGAAAPASEVPQRRKSGSSTALLVFAVLFGAVGWHESSRETFHDWVAAAQFGLGGLGDINLDRHTRLERFPASASGVVVHDPERAFEGYNIELSSMEHSARLLDMKGEEIHRWELDRTAITRAYAAAGKPFTGDARGPYWRRVKPLPDGSLLVVMENHRTTPYGVTLMKLDWNSNIVWAQPDFYHHSVDVAPDGRIITLYQEISDQPPSFAPEAKVPFLDEGVAILAADGQELDRIAIAAAFEGTPFASHLKRVADNVDGGDPYHMNTANYVTASQALALPFANEGDILVCIRNLDMIALLDPVTRKITWAASGNWVRPHEPLLTDRGTILIYDNSGGENGTSRVVEWDPLAQNFRWIADRANGLRLLSPIYGAIDELPNGNRLVSSSLDARALEFDRSGKLVWEWRPTRRYGPENNRTSDLLEMIRVPIGFFSGKLAGTEAGDQVAETSQ